MPQNPNISRYASEVIMVEEAHVSCDGDGGALGHPRVYLEMGNKLEIECPYCDRIFRRVRAKN